MRDVQVCFLHAACRPFAARACFAHRFEPRLRECARPLCLLVFFLALPLPAVPAACVGNAVDGTETNGNGAGGTTWALWKTAVVKLRTAP